MKALTIRLGQFAICALVLTVLFRYALNLSIEANSVVGTTTCSIVYGCLIFLIGWNFGTKDAKENEVHDIGFRYHLVTYIFSIGTGYGVHYLGWNAESLRAMTITAISWGIGLLIHFIFYLIEQRKTIKGYAKEEIFQ
ncbi:MAG: hypothetical protein IKD40_04250 [Bacteroidaceae bacterium]|nr:hypothetical protein [Bacteroidaceae bacterium]